MRSSFLQGCHADHGGSRRVYTRRAEAWGVDIASLLAPRWLQLHGQHHGACTLLYRVGQGQFYSLLGGSWGVSRLKCPQLLVGFFPLPSPLLFPLLFD